MAKNSQSSGNRSRTVLLSLLIIAAICALIGGILSTIGVILGIQVFWGGLLFLVGGVFSSTLTLISLFFAAFQHPDFTKHFDEIADNIRISPKFLRTAIIIFLSVAISVGLIYGLIRFFPPANTSFCLRAVSWPLFCGDALGASIITVQDDLGAAQQIKTGLIDKVTDAPFNLAPLDPQKSELSIDNMIFKANQNISGQPHLTLVVVTMLSTTSDDSGLSVNAGLEDLKGAALFQYDYNQQHTIKLRLVLGNIGTRFTATATVPLVMKRIALLAKQDVTFRGVLGLPFSSSTRLALAARDSLNMNNIPFIAPTATSDQLSNEANFYRIPSPDKTQSCALLDFIANHLIPALGASRAKQFNIAIFSDPQDPYSFSLANDLTAIVTGNNRCDSYSAPFGTAQLYLIPESYTVGDSSDKFSLPIDDAIAHQMDMAFFSGYAYDLGNFEGSLIKEEGRQIHPKHILIVGGDGFSEVSSQGNSYTTVYASAYTPPLDDSAKFVTEYKNNFGAKNLIYEQHKVILPIHAILAYDAAQAFLEALHQNTSNTLLPDQDNFDTYLGKVRFNGLSGYVKFNANQNSDGSSLGISDPLNKNIYIICINTQAQTKEAASYTPGPKPTITIYLRDKNLLDCKT